MTVAVDAHTTVLMSSSDKEDFGAAFAELGLEVRLGPPLEVRGGADAWRLILETDWGVVRDTIIAGAIASGIGAGSRAAAQKLRALFNRVALRTKGPKDGIITLKEKDAPVELLIRVQDIDSDAPWEQLMQTRLEGRLVWSPEDMKWIENDRGRT